MLLLEIQKDYFIGMFLSVSIPFLPKQIVDEGIKVYNTSNYSTILECAIKIQMNYNSSLF